MARQVLPIVGAVIGAYFGNPQLGFMIGSAHGPSAVPEGVEDAPIGAIFGGKDTAELVYRGPDNEPT